MISIIAAIGKNNELGKKNDLLWNLPADMKHFREITKGHTVIMGQKTFESLGKDENGKQVGRLLPNRRNIILTQDHSFKVVGAEVVYSAEELMNLLETTSTKEEENFIIGGGMIYKLFIDKADKLYITHVDASFPDAEVFFPEIIPIVFLETSREEYKKDTENPYNYTFTTYTRF
jgi:dihydrofolate reductase